ncbi:MAG: NAD(P)-dependent oxidoreductase [Patescibacteria group bacterium]
MKHVIVTGGCGFIGSALVKQLNRHRLVPTIIDIRKPTSSLRGLEFRFKMIDVAVRNTSITKLFQNIGQTVVHLAAMHYIPECEMHPQECFRTNVYGTYNIVDLVKKSRGSRLLFASSGAVYPSSSKNLDELSELQPDSIYGETKKLAESIIQGHLNGRNKIFRLFNVYGPNDNTPHLIPSIVHQLNKGDVVNLGNLHTERDYIFISDVVSCFIKEILKPRPAPIYNIGTGVGSSAARIMSEVENIINRSIRVRTASTLLRSTDKERLVSNPRKARNDYEIKNFISLNQGLSALLNNKV